MRISNELLGKEVIDKSGDQVGIVTDVEWNFKSNKISSIILKESSISAKIGLRDKKVINYEMIDAIGDKVLIKGKLLSSK